MVQESAKDIYDKANGALVLEINNLRAQIDSHDKQITNLTCLTCCTNPRLPLALCGNVGCSVQCLPCVGRTLIAGSCSSCGFKVGLRRGKLAKLAVPKVVVDIASVLNSQDCSCR